MGSSPCIIPSMHSLEHQTPFLGPPTPTAYAHPFTPTAYSHPPADHRDSCGRHRDAYSHPPPPRLASHPSTHLVPHSPYPPHHRPIPPLPRPRPPRAPRPRHSLARRRSKHYRPAVPHRRPHRRRRAAPATSGASGEAVPYSRCVLEEALQPGPAVRRCRRRRDASAGIGVGVGEERGAGAVIAGGGERTEVRGQPGGGVVLGGRDDSEERPSLRVTQMCESLVMTRMDPSILKQRNDRPPEM